MMTGINVIGKRIDDTQDEENLGINQLLHLFIHFNLGIPFDRALPGIFRIEIDEQQKKRLEKITDFLKTENCPNFFSERRIWIVMKNDV